MNFAEQLHESYGLGRRVRVLSHHLEALLPVNGHILDVGCGDGTLDASLQTLRPDLRIEGIDVLVRPKAKIPVREFDGLVIPHPDDSFDCVVFVDVLHHSHDVIQLLREARRVSRGFIVIKDHRRNGFLAQQTLRFMDDVGNKRFGVNLPHHYWSQEQWDSAFSEVELDVVQWKQDLAIYPWPASLFFDRGLHFVAQLGGDSTTRRTNTTAPDSTTA
ncbi:MAG: class I SAM-dependent methyltransferase [Deltaproteobacteria bacterium]|nr:class I SAM-dependent methyltransferase [Deltaproteobacteria bacterium]MBW2724932.1 class I SAM-dependent methyltransferase [Deltaproteobacteria bacterium]